MNDEPTQLTAPDHQLPVGEVSFSSSNEGLAVLIGSMGIHCSWVLSPHKEGLTWTFGRGTKADFMFPNTKRRLSGIHFKIWATQNDPPAIMIQDTSTNGTFLNNVRIPKGRNCMLMNGDVIVVGLGVKADEIKLVVSIPKTSKATPQGGVYEFYDFGELIGQGAFALVRQAVNRETGENVAIKIIDKAKITGSLEMAVEREIEILKKLRHPNIVTLHDIFIDEKHYYLVMDFVPHGDLMDYLISQQTPQQPGIPEQMSRDIVKQVLEAVAYVHSMGISHRDLKPDNILINSFDPVSVKVADFGLAKLQAQGTFLKTFCGTLAYLAPEVLLSRQQQHDPKGTQDEKPAVVYTKLVDIWSVGCLAYVILTGCMPFGGGTQEELYRSVLAGDYHKGPLENSNISEEAKSFIANLLDVDTESRPQAEQALRHPWFLPEGQQSAESASAAETADNSAQEKETSSATPRERRKASAPNLGRPEFSAISSIPSSLDKPSMMQGYDEDESDLDSEETRLKVNYIASQNREQSQNVDPRDFGDDENNVAGGMEPENYWAELETMPASLPCKDLYITKSHFTIGRCNNKLDRSQAYDGPLLDFTHPDPRLSRIHCMLSLESDKQGKLAVWLEAYHYLYVNTTQLQALTRMRVYDGDKICLFAAPTKQGTFEKLVFMLKLHGEPADFVHFHRPADERKNPLVENAKYDGRGPNREASMQPSMALPVPETPLKLKRERSQEMVPGPKRMNTVFK